MKKTLMILAHPNMDESIANKKIVNYAKENVDNLEVRDLHELYPTFQVDVDQEQEKLAGADIIIFQFPWYWYSSPAILKEYMDKVMSFNFAYGPLGDKLRGKEFFVSTTVGGPEDGYRPGGANHYYIDDLLNPFQETALKTGMLWRRAIRSHQMIYVPGVYHTQEEVEMRAQKHAEELVNRIHSLQAFSEEKHIESFVKEYYGKMDELAETGYFIQHIGGRSTFEFEEGHYAGHGGFMDWYDRFKSRFASKRQHEIETIQVSSTSDKMLYDASVSLRFQGIDTTGNAIDQKRTEAWQIRLTTDKRIQVESCLVEK